MVPQCFRRSYNVYKSIKSSIHILFILKEDKIHPRIWTLSINNTFGNIQLPVLAEDLIVHVSNNIFFNFHREYI